MDKKMRKLSDPDYLLPTVEALSAFSLFETGTTTPMAVWAVDTVTGSRGQYVVKFKNANRMTTASSAFELIGAWMARELDLPAVEPVLINISTDFVETALKGKDGYKAAFQSQGINFGSVYQAGYTSIPEHGFTLTDDMMEQLKMLYVFDVFISNADRGHQKPNITANGNELLIFDHELAFSFLRVLPFQRNKTPWILNEMDREIYSKHFCFHRLKNSGLDFQQQVANLKRFDTDFWNKVFKTLPQDWINDEIRQIQPYLTSIVENQHYFAKSLNNTVAL